MNKDLFMDKLLQRAKERGLETAEVFSMDSERFNVLTMNGEVCQYQVSASGGLSLRGTVKGKMGYASTQATDDAAIEQLIEGVLESAALTESHEQDEIFAGEASYPDYKAPESDLDQISAEDKVAAALKMNDVVLGADKRITKADAPSVSSSKTTITLRNSFGLKLSYTDTMWSAYVSAIAPRENGTVANEGYFLCGRNFAEMKPEVIGTEAVRRTLQSLSASPVASGTYRVIFSNEAMASMLATFCGMFSAESAQQGLSLFAGKEGETVAAPVVTLMDDPLLPSGFASCPFDAEGSASRTKAVLENGVLKTLLHNRKTARKQGVETTGNAARGGYSSPVSVAPTNMFFQPGDQTLDALMAEMGDGLVITGVGGLHAGANPISGDFSLISSGYVVEGGKRGHDVDQITVAGNFYQLLKNIRAVSSDLYFPGDGIGSPSVDVGTLVISGK